MATVSGVAETKASITLSLILSASAVSGQAEATASMVLLVLPSARITTAIAESIGTYIRTIGFNQFCDVLKVLIEFRGGHFAHNLTSFCKSFCISALHVLL